MLLLHIPLLRSCALQIFDGEQMERADFEQQQSEDQRYREICEAIDRCAKAGGDIDDLKLICRETGVSIKHTVLGDEIKLTNRRAA